MSQMPLQLRFLVTLNVEHFCGKRRTVSVEGLHRRAVRAVSKFNSQLPSFIQQQHLNPQSAVVDMPGKSLVSFTQDTAVFSLRAELLTANNIRNMPGVKSVEIQHIVHPTK